MVGYEGETWRDLDETARHLRESLPDDLLTTLAYPIKGTPYYEDVADRIIAPHAWAESSDRELTVAGRRSRRFYRHAQGWLKAELEAARDAPSSPRNPEQPARHRFRGIRQRFRSAKFRAGMYLTRHETEQEA